MGGFSGKISLDDSEPLLLTSHISLPQDDIDPRVNIIKEYLLKSPNAIEKDLKKALTHFSKATDDEFKEIIKSANIDKYNELFQQIQLTTIINSKQSYAPIPEEIEFLEQYRSSGYKRRDLFKLYKLQFPNSTRNIKFMADYYRHHPQPLKKEPIKHVINNQENHHIQNNHILAQAIKSLHKSGKSPKIFSQIKPVIDLITDPNEIEFAIECLTS